MSSEYDPDENDVRDESMSKTTRRGLLGALGVAGLASLGSSGASANLSGGPEADAMAEYRVPTYRVPESDLDTPGIVGRRAEITSAGTEWSAGDQLVDTGSTWERIDAGVGSLKTDSAVSRTTSTVDATPANEALRSQKTDWSWQDIEWEDKGEPIITDTDPNEGNGDAAWPSMLYAAGTFQNPIDDWYCFVSTHDFNYIGIHTAPSPWGPWTFETTFEDPAGTQTASPWVIEDPQSGRVNLYYHVDDDGQYTKLATSPLTGDGTSFSIEGTALDTATPQHIWDAGQRTYMQGVRRGKEFLGVYQGRDRTNAHGIGLCRSLNGESFTKTQRYPAFDNTQFEGMNPQEGQAMAPSLVRAGGQLWVLYLEDSTSEIRALPYEMADVALGETGETVYTQPSWSSTSPVGQELHNDGEHLYLLYYTSSPEYSTGIARAELGGGIA